MGIDPVVNIGERFRRHDYEGDRSGEALPTALVEGCRQLLNVDGVGISLTQEVRVPLAATSADVATAERLQTTLGEGPCLTAAGQGTSLVADAESIAAAWPLFGAALVEGTPFRSVASVPLTVTDGGAFGAVDLYVVDGGGGGLAAAIGDAEQMGQLMGASLLAAVGTGDARSTISSWLRSPSANPRFRVWIAVGMVMAQAGAPSRDALAMLRGYAFSHGLTLDDVADLLASRQLRPDTIGTT